MARLRVLGEVAAQFPSGEFDVAAIQNGGRRRGPGYDWVVIQLGSRARLHCATVDTAHFKGNFSERCSMDAADNTSPWKPIPAETKLQADTAHEFALRGTDAVTKVRLNIYPDGGVARLRIWGTRD